MTMLRSLIVSLLALVVVSSALAAEPMTLEQLRAARTQAANRQRRLIYNNDGNEPVYFCKNTTPEELLRLRTTGLEGTTVDSIFYCTWCSGFGLFTHPTKAGYLFDTKEDMFKENLITEMLAAGTDPLQVMIDYGRKHNIEVFWSHRMNDTHDSYKQDYSAVMYRANPMKVAHPDWLIGTLEQKPQFGGFAAVDFARPEIRDLVVKYFEEVCQNYDVDGVEMDFFRHPVFFKRAAQAGVECNDEERAQMTEVMQRIRKVTEVEGMKRGRPILVSIRVPDSVEYCRATGLDLERWLSEGLCDLLMLSSYFRLEPWKTNVDLGHKYGVKVYPSLDESRVLDPEAVKLRMTRESYRGRALEVWNSGADGVYTFNLFEHFEPKDPIWSELGAREKLAKLDQDYFASIRGGQKPVRQNWLPFGKYQKVPNLTPMHPKQVTVSQPARESFEMGNDVSTANTATATLRLQFKDLGKPEDVSVTLNGHTLSSPRQSEGWLEFTLQPGQLKQGTNEVQVSLAKGQDQLNWTDLHSTLRFK